MESIQRQSTTGFAAGKTALDSMRLCVQHGRKMRQRLEVPLRLLWLVALLLCAISLPATSAVASEHLIPEDSEFTRADLPIGTTSLAPYYTMAISALKDAFAADVVARMIAMPSFTPEYAVGIKVNDGNYSIFRLELEIQVWRYEMLQSLREIPRDSVPEGVTQSYDEAMADLEGSLPGDIRDIGLRACEIAIAPELGRDLMRVWEAMLLETAYNQSHRLGPDGTDYHFSMAGFPHNLAGKIWNPPPESKTGNLVGIADAMQALCVTGDANLVEQLRPQVDALLRRLEE